MQHLAITIRTYSETPEESNLPELVMIDGVAYCTSLQVADHFDKRHDHVMRDIVDTITQVIETSDKPKFGGIENLFKKTDYTLTNNFGHPVKKPMYLLTEDGFTLLAMGYSGVKAMGFKLRYMAAFRQMRETLTSGTRYTPPMREPEQPTTITAKQWQELKSQVSMTTACLRHTGSSAEHHILSALRILHNITDLQRMPSSQYPAVLATAKAMLDNARGEYLTFAHDLEQTYIQRHLCGGLPLTATIKREWRKQHQTAFPQSPNWMQIANDLGMMPPPANH